MTSPNRSVHEKRDLHVGGIGAAGIGAAGIGAAGNGAESAAALSKRLDSLVDPLLDAVQPLLRKARDAMQGADDYVHDNPWAALGVVALAGLAAGFFLSRRS